MANSSAPLHDAPQPHPRYAIRKILVAHDGSPTASVSLQDAVDIAKAFGSEIVLARVQLPETEMANAAHAAQKAEDIAELEAIQQDLTRQGVHARALVRTGMVGDTLFNITHKENIDLLMLGAYGMGRCDRITLGSTAEHLLRAIPCPALTYGPEAQPGLMKRLKKDHPILMPIPIPCPHTALDFAGRAASLFGASLELLHVIGGPQDAQIYEKHEKACHKLIRDLTKQGVKAFCTISFGVADAVIHATALEHDAPLLLMPLKRRDRLTSITSDNVAAQTIRKSRVPVMSYRLD